MSVPENLFLSGRHAAYMDITLVYFTYGLAFFSLGLAVLFEADRSPSLGSPAALRPLIIFGFVHGAHEWLEMFLDKSGWIVFSNPALVGEVRIVLLFVSFLALLAFGVMMLGTEAPTRPNQQVRWAAAGAAYVLLILALCFLTWHRHADRTVHLDVLVRYFMAIPAALLAGLALARQSVMLRSTGQAPTGDGLAGAAFGFFVYGLTQLVVPRLDVFPANVLNTASFTAFIGFPIQIVRAATAVIITLSLIYTANVLEKRRQAQLLSSEQARIDALDQLRTELLAREQMRQGLMRSIVLAQEDERARIARELHDETSQTLTAFTFHLAVLRQLEPRNDKARQQLEYLQTLSRQMSQDIYRLVRDLRPAQLDDLGLVAALQYLISETEKRTGLITALHVSGDKRRLDALVETVLFRVAQESLTNVARHAGVQSARLYLAFLPERVTLRIEDDGQGFDPAVAVSPSGGLGLVGIRERVESIGGNLYVDSAPGFGTRVEVQADTPLETSPQQAASSMRAA
jgi:signal transduction histidine kinase